MIKLKGNTRNVLLIIGGIFTIFLLWYFSALVTYVLISVVLSFVGRPLVRWLTKFKIGRFGIPKGLAAFFTLIAIWVVFTTFFWFIIPLLISELQTLSQIDLEMFISSVEVPLSQLMQFFHKEPVLLEEQTFLDVLIQQLSTRFDFSQLTNIFTLIAGILGDFLIAFFSVSFITFFFLKEEKMFREGILLIVPTELETKVSRILDSIAYLLRRYFIGILLEVFMVMLLNTIGLTIVGVEFNHAVVIGLFCGIFNVIPYLGPWMGAIVGLLIGTALNINADFMSQTLPLLGLMSIVFLSVQLIDNVLFQPLIYSSSVKAHPIEIFIVILAAGSMAGILGMFLAIPVYTILRVIAKEFFENLKIVKKITENLDQEKEKKITEKNN
jgi:predicted PurR-regulated permease PerM